MCPENRFKKFTQSVSPFQSFTSFTLIWVANIRFTKRNKLDVFGYLMHLLTVLPEWGKNPTDEQLESVMPWSESLPDFCRQEYDEIRQ